MLETLVSSRIRRTLFEYLVNHPQDRFYLRGLAKQLSLSVSPLRRELKRLENSGMLRAVHEANVVFYMVNTTSPEFLQLQQAGQAVSASSTPALEASQPSGESQAAKAAVALLTPVTPAIAAPTPPAEALRGERPVRTDPSVWTAPLRTPVMVGVTGVGVALMLIVAGLFYLSFTNRQLVSTIAQRRVAVPGASRPSASGLMRGGRWQLVPGGFGGFSTDTHREVY